MKKVRKKKEVVVAVSGGFDPIHAGHVRLFENAKKLGTKLIVILNNDNWLRKKKHVIFMYQKERKEIIEGLRAVDKVVLTGHPKNPKYMDVSRELARLKPDIFANGGDRHNKNTPEIPVCQRIGCRMAWNVGHGGKVQSSSWLLAKYHEEMKKHEKKKNK